MSPSATKSAFEHNSIENVDALNEDSDYWLRQLESDQEFIESIYHELVSCCRIADANSVADYGCGTGVLVNKLSKDFPAISVFGFDFSESKIQQCQEYYDINPACFAVGDVYAEPMAHYDVITATEVLEHLRYPRRAVRNLIAGLAPGGRLFLTVPNGRTDQFGGHIHFWSPESWQLFLDGTIGGAESVSIVKTGMMVGKNYALLRNDE